MVVGRGVGLCADGWQGTNTSTCLNIADDRGLPVTVLGGFGRLQNGDITLAVTDIPARHEYLLVSFDFYAIDLWNDTASFNVSVDGEVQYGGAKTSGPYFVGTLDDGCGQLMNPSGRADGLGVDGFHQVCMRLCLRVMGGGFEWGGGWEGKAVRAVEAFSGHTALP